LAREILENVMYKSLPEGIMIGKWFQEKVFKRKNSGKEEF